MLRLFFLLLYCEFVTFSKLFINFSEKLSSEKHVVNKVNDDEKNYALF